MAFLLRAVTNPKWAAPSWLPAGHVPAEALTDLRANNNELSVWSVESDRSNLNMALTAAASSRDRLDKLDYMLLDEAILPPIRIRYETSEGNTPYLTANASIHRDLIELTVHKVAQLAHEMMPLTPTRVSQKDVQGLLLEALQSGALDRTRIKPKLLSELEPKAKLAVSPAPSVASQINQESLPSKPLSRIWCMKHLGTVLLIAGFLALSITATQLVITGGRPRWEVFTGIAAPVLLVLGLLFRRL